MMILTLSICLLICSLVVVLLKPYHLRGRLHESLGRAVQWAAQRKGQHQETAKQVSSHVTETRASRRLQWLI
jgi:hypothetical protein